MAFKGLIIPFSEALDAGISHVGGKAYSLARCLSLGFCIPKGVILPVKAYRDYINGERQDSTYSALHDFFKDTPQLIIRSSGLEEDEADTSFAGQFLSTTSGNEAQIIKKNVEACFRSYHSDNAGIYRTELAGKKKNQGSGMALLVQQLVNASASGVCFTADPLTGKKDKIAINSVHGLGETLMSGEVISDHYEFDIESGNISRKICGEQRQWRSSADPKTLSPMPKDLQGQPALTDDQIAEIVNLARKAEVLFQTPLDIEWAYEGDDLYLLQVRPITTSRKKNKFTLWTRDNVADVIPDAVTPLSWSILGEVTNDSFNNVVRSLGLPWQSVVLFQTFDSRVYFNGTAYGKLSGLREELMKKPTVLIQSALRYFLMMVGLSYKVGKIERSFSATMESILRNSGTPAILALKKYLNDCMRLHFRTTILMDIGFMVIRKIATRYLSSEPVTPVVDALVTGLKRIESTQVAESILELAGIISRDTNLSEALRVCGDKDLPNVLKEWGEPYAQKWDDILIKYGYSSLKEFELYYPRWSEDPSFLAKTLKQFTNEAACISLTNRETDRVQARLEAERTLLNEVPWKIRPLLKYYIRHVQNCSVWRESVKQKLVKIMSEIRKQAIRFAEQQALAPIENVFFLELDEMGKVEASGLDSDTLSLLKNRKRLWEQHLSQEAFREIRQHVDGRVIKVPFWKRTEEDMKGLPLSSGTYAGRATVILDPNGYESLNGGEVLVTHSVNPAWTPLIRLAGAIVVDMGNYLSHGAIVAREFGIPAVGNVYSATKKIRSGEMIYVDGDSGVVKKIKEVHNG